ncbi:MAG TPA: thioredoxin domain-containing protein [Thermoanaerobaculia bacterium]|nr:thioredoxin domain-containing protein [Thermoanaerobaculia bacterium]
MKRPFLLAALSLAALTVCAATTPNPNESPKPGEVPKSKLGERADKLIVEGLPVCSEPSTEKISFADLQHKLPPNLDGQVIRIESPRQSCAGQWVAVTSATGDFFLGIPWFLDDVKGTPDQKVKSFGWNALQQNIDSTIDKQPNHDGFFNVAITETTESGRMPMQAEMDPNASVLFIGHFHPENADFRESRLKYFQPFINQSPVTGAAKPVVTIIEFSDFECPSCKYASDHDYAQKIVDAHPDQVRYIRYDLPLVTMHPWAFAAAVAGRAIYRQKPELFWDYKKQVYANQEQLSAFTIDDFAKHFAADHDLDMKKYAADVNSDEIKASILAGAGAAFSNDVRATPTYMVNGTMVDAGDDGKFLASYVAGLLKK